MAGDPLKHATSPPAKADAWAAPGLRRLKPARPEAAHPLLLDDVGRRASNVALIRGMAMDVARRIERLRRYYDRQDCNWQTLPVEGASLTSCFIESCGKDGEMLLLTREYPPLTIPLNAVFLKGLDGVEQSCIPLDDKWVGIVIEPEMGRTVRLVEARVDFWLTDEDPSVFLAVPTDGDPWEYIAAFVVALRFGVVDK